MNTCSICHYPISKTVQFLMAANIRLKPSPNVFVCECGIYDAERERLGHGDPAGLIKLMEEKGFNDWHYMSYKLANNQTIDLFEGRGEADGGGGGEKT